MPLGVLGDVPQQQPERHFDALPPHVPRVPIVDILHHPHLAHHPLKSGSD